MHTKLPLKIAFRMVGSSYVATVVDLEEKTQGLELASLARSVAAAMTDPFAVTGVPLSLAFEFLFILICLPHPRL